MARTRILIVEDESSVAKDLERRIGRMGYDVAGIVMTGEESILKAGTEIPDVVLMDIYLKGEIDGTQAASEIQERLRIPVIYLTGYSDDDTLKKASVIHSYGYLLKPFDDRSLKATIEIALYRRRLERKYELSENWFATTLRSIGESVIATDEHGRVRFMNASAESLTGWEDHEAENQPLGAVVQTIDISGQALPADPVAQILNGSVTALLKRHVVLLSRDGRRIPIEQSASPIKDERGKVVGVVLVAQDVADRRHAEEALRTSEERYRRLVEMSPVPIAVHSEGKFVFANNAALELIGATSSDQVVGRPVLGFVHGDFQKMVKDRIRTMEADGDVPTAQEQLVRLDGKTVDVEIAAMPFLWEGKKAIQVVVQDVTDRRRAEIAIRASESKYRALFENVLDGVFQTSPDGVILTANPALVRMLGYDSEAELLRVNVGEHLYVNPEDRRRLVRRLTEEGSVRNEELLLRKKDGTAITVLENGHVVRRKNGEILYLEGTLTDITERKRLEDQLRLAQKMESLGTLASGVAHNFNNILTIIKGYAALLKKEGKSSVRFEDWLDAISMSVDRGASVVRQLRDFAHVDETTFEPVDLNRTVDELTKLVHETFPETIVLESRLDRTIPPIMADASQIYQVCLNLLVNARDAIGTRGTIRIGTSQVQGANVRSRLADVSEGAYVCVYVEDDGRGMSAETRARLFEPFFTTKGIGEGSGLGLAVAYGLVRGHRGFIDVEAGAGKGTRFSVYFPAAPTAVVAPKGESEEYAAQRGTETILLVEDETMLLDLLQLLLESHGYRVLKATDGEEAVDIYKREREKVALVVTDMGLPKLGGWEAFQRMRAINPCVKAIMASGYLDPKLRADMLKAGAKDFIQKPYVPDQILQRIREVIDEEA